MAPCYGWRSPHTRGARVQHQPVKAQPRIIPAYAGSTDRPLGRPRPGADHPRIRGEHGQGVEIQRQEGGSSPHTRGAPQDEGYGGEFEGIIPAGVHRHIDAFIDVEKHFYLPWRDFPGRGDRYGGT